MASIKKSIEFITTTQKWNIASLQDCKFVDQVGYVKVVWEDFPADMASWEPIHVLQEDVPVMLKLFISRIKDKNLRNLAKNAVI